MRALAITLGSVLTLSACNSQQKTEELIQARLEAEKAKELATQVQDLKTTNEDLRKENETLKLELATLKAKETAQAAQRNRVATATPAKKPTAQKPAARDDGNAGGTAADSKMTDAQTQELRRKVTGGSSLK